MNLIPLFIFKVLAFYCIVHGVVMFKQIRTLNSLDMSLHTFVQRKFTEEGYVDLASDRR